MKPPPLQSRIGAAAVGFVACLPMACVGTLVHEGGHIAVARFLGYPTVLHFGSMNYVGANNAAVTLGGPAANLLVGTVGLVALALRRHQRGWPEVAAWLAALFWSRQPFDALLVLASGGAGRTDELRLERAYDLPAGSVVYGTALPGLLVCGAACVLLGRERTVPLAAGGVAGCLAGYAVWYGFAGPALLP